MADIKDTNATQTVVYNDNAISLYQPESSTSRSNVYVRPGDLININFDIKQTRVEIINGDVHLVFPNGSSMSLISLASVGFGPNAPVIRDLQGNILSLDEFLNKAYVLNYNQAYLILTNRDNYQLSEEQPNVISTASDNQTTFDGGTPVSGVGSTDIPNRGQLAKVFQAGAVDALGSFRGSGEFSVTSFRTVSPFNSNTSNILPGTKVIEPKPNLTYTVLYGSELLPKGPVSLVGSAGNVRSFASSFELSFLDETASADQEAMIKPIIFDRSLANTTDNVFINNTREYMDYIFELNYSKGVYPTSVEIILQTSEKSANISVVPYGASSIKENSLQSFGGGLSGYSFALDSLDSSGISKFILRLPYGIADRSFDITYRLTYVDPNTSTIKDAFFTQQVFIKPVSSIQDLLEGKNVLSSGASGVDVITGSGNDIVLGGIGVNNIVSGAGDDLVFSGLNADYIELGAGNDSYWGSLGFDFIDGGEGLDTVYYNNQKLDIDASGNIFKDSFFQTYKGSIGFVVKLGFDSASLNALLYGAKKDQYSALINSSSILVNQNQGSFNLLNNVESIFTANDVKDIVEVADNLVNTVKVNAGTFIKDGTDLVVIDKDVSRGAIFDFTKSVSSKGFSEVYVYFDDISKSAIFSNFNRFSGGKGDDLFYGDINYNANTEGKKNITFYLIGGLGYDTVNYSRSNNINHIVFDASQAVVSKYVAGSEVALQTDQLVVETSAGGVNLKFEKIVGSRGKDTFYANYGNNYDYASGDDAVKAITDRDLVSYANTNTGVNGFTLVLAADGSKSAYKGFFSKYTKAELDSFISTMGSRLDRIDSDLNVSLSKVSDVIVSELTGSYNFSEDIRGGVGSNSKDFVSYVNVSGPITLTMSQDDTGSVVVNKTGGGNDNFNFLYPTTSGSSFLQNDIYGVVGSERDDLFYMNRGFATISNKIVGGGGRDTLSYKHFSALDSQKQGVDFKLSGSGSGIVTKYFGGTDLFEGILKFEGTSLTDTFYLSSIDFSSSFSYEIDLLGGLDFINLNGAKKVNPANPTSFLDLVNGAKVSFEVLADSTLKMNVNFEDDLSPSSTVSLSFLNIEGFIGTSVADEVFIEDSLLNEELFFDGGLGLDIANYSALNYDLVFDVRKNLVKKIDGSLVVEDKVQSTEIFKGGTKSNTFKSQSQGSFTFIGSSTSVDRQTLDYSDFDTGVIFDFTAGSTNKVVYKYSYSGRDWLEYLETGDKSKLTNKDNYENITYFKGSQGSDSFLIDEGSADGLILDGGGRGQDIVDVSSYTRSVNIELNTPRDVDVESSLTIISAGLSKILSTKGIKGIRGTQYDDSFVLIGNDDNYIDGNVNTVSSAFDLVDYSQNIDLDSLLNIRDISMEFNKSFITDSVRSLDNLLNIQKIILPYNITLNPLDSTRKIRNEVSFRVLNATLKEIEGSVLANNIVSFNNFDGLSKPSIDFNSTAVQVKGVGSSVNLINFSEIRGSSFFVLDVNVFDLPKLQNFIFDSVNLKFNSLNLSSLSSPTALSLNISTALNGSSATLNGSTYHFTLSAMKGFVLTPQDDSVSIEDFSFYNTFYGSGGNDILSYASLNSTQGVKFSFDRNASSLIYGKVLKESGFVDTYYDFYKIEGTRLGDTVEISNLALINQLVNRAGGFSIDLKGSTSSILDTVFFNIVNNIGYEMSGSRLYELDVPSNSLPIDWITSTEADGTPANLILKFGSGNDEVFYNDVNISYKTIDAGLGSNTLDASSSRIPLYYSSITDKASSSKASLTDASESTVIASKEYFLKGFSVIKGASIGDNYFYGSAPIRANSKYYYGSSLVDTDTIDYSKVYTLDLDFSFSLEGGNLVGKVSVGSFYDQFQFINNIVGSSKDNRFIFAADVVSRLNGLNIVAGNSTQDAVFLNMTSASNYTISSTGVNISTQGGSITGSLGLTNASKIEIIQFANSVKDSVIVNNDVNLPYIFNAYEAGNSAYYQDDNITYNIDNIFNHPDYGNISIYFDSTNKSLKRATTASTAGTEDTVIDTLNGFIDISYSGSNFMAVRGSELAFKYSGKDDQFNLILDYSTMLLSGGSGIKFIMSSSSNAIVEKGASDSSFNDIVKNIKKVIGTTNSDEFVLFDRTDFLAGATGSKGIVIEIDGGGGNDSVSFATFTSLQSFSSLQPSASVYTPGAIGNEYLLNFTSIAGRYSLSVNGYQLNGIRTYKFTASADRFVALPDAEVKSEISIDGYDGVDILDYGFRGTVRDYDVDLVNGLVQRKATANNIPIPSSNSYTDLVANFERVITGSGDDTYKINEKQLLADLGGVSSSFYLLDSGSGKNSLDFSSVDTKNYLLTLDFSYTSGLYKSIINIKNSPTNTNSVNNTTTSVGFTDFNSNRANINYTYDDIFLNPNNNFNFNAVNRAEGFPDTQFSFNSSVSKTINISQITIANDYDIKVNGVKIGHLANYDVFSAGSNNTLKLLTDAQGYARFIGGDGVNDEADLTIVTADNIVLQINSIEDFAGGVRAKIKFTSSLNTSGLFLEGFETVKLPNINSTVVLQERIGSSLTPLKIIAGNKTGDRVSFIAFTNAISGINANGYDLSGFETYQLTNLPDVWDIAEDKEQDIDAAGGVDTVRFRNSSGSYSSGISLSESINGSGSVYYKSIKNDTTTNPGTSIVRQDILTQFEKFELTDSADIFTTDVSGKWNAQNIDIDFKGGNNKADFSTISIVNFNLDGSVISGVTPSVIFDILFDNNLVNIDASLIRKGIKADGSYGDIVRLYKLKSVNGLLSTVYDDIFKLKNTVINQADLTLEQAKRLNIVAEAGNNTLDIQDLAFDNYEIKFNSYLDTQIKTTKSKLEANIDSIANFNISNSLDINSKGFYRFLDFNAFDRNYNLSLSNYTEKAVLSYYNIVGQSLSYELDNDKVSVYAGEKLSSGQIHHDVSNINIIGSNQGDNIINIKNMVNVNLYGSDDISGIANKVNILHNFDTIITDLEDSNFFTKQQLLDTSLTGFEDIIKNKQSYININSNGKNINLFGYKEIKLNDKNNTVNYYVTAGSLTGVYNATAGINDKFVILKQSDVNLDDNLIKLNLVNEYLTYTIESNEKTINLFGFEDFTTNNDNFNLELTLDKNLPSTLKSITASNATGLNNTVVLLDGVKDMNILSSTEDINITLTNNLGVDKTIKIKNFSVFNFSVFSDNVTVNTAFFKTRSVDYLGVDLDGNIGAENILNIKRKDNLDLLRMHVFGSNINIFNIKRPAVGSEISSVIGVKNFSTVNFDSGVDILYSANFVGKLDSITASVAERSKFSFYAEQSNGIIANSLFGLTSSVVLDIKSNQGSQETVSQVLFNGETVNLTNFTDFNLGSFVDTVNLNINKLNRVININTDIGGTEYQLSGSNIMNIIATEDILAEKVLNLSIGKDQVNKATLSIGSQVATNFVGFNSIYFNTAELKDVKLNVEYNAYISGSIKSMFLYGTQGEDVTNSSSLFFTNPSLEKIRSINVSADSIFFTGIKNIGDGNEYTLEASNFENVYFGYKSDSSLSNVNTAVAQTSDKKKTVFISDVAKANGSYKNYNFFAERKTSSAPILMNVGAYTEGSGYTGAFAVNDSVAQDTLNTSRSSSDSINFSSFSAAISYNFYSTFDSGGVVIDSYKTYGDGSQSNPNSNTDHWLFNEFERIVGSNGNDYFDFYNIDLSTVTKTLHLNASVGSVALVNINPANQKVINNTYIVDNSNNIKVYFNSFINLITAVRPEEREISSELIALTNNVVDIINFETTAPASLTAISTGIGRDRINLSANYVVKTINIPLNNASNANTPERYYDARGVADAVTRNVVGVGILAFSDNYDIVRIPRYSETTTTFSSVNKIRTGAGSDKIVVDSNFALSNTTSFSYNTTTGGAITLVENVAVSGSNRSMTIEGVLYDTLVIGGVSYYFTKQNVSGSDQYVIYNTNTSARDYNEKLNADIAAGLAKPTPSNLGEFNATGTNIYVEDTRDSSKKIRLTSSHVDEVWKIGASGEYVFDRVINAKTRTLTSGVIGNPATVSINTVSGATYTAADYGFSAINLASSLSSGNDRGVFGDGSNARIRGYNFVDLEDKHFTFIFGTGYSYSSSGVSYNASNRINFYGVAVDTPGGYYSYSVDNNGASNVDISTTTYFIRSSNAIFFTLGTDASTRFVSTIPQITVAQPVLTGSTATSSAFITSGNTVANNTKQIISFKGLALVASIANHNKYYDTGVGGYDTIFFRGDTPTSIEVDKNIVLQMNSSLVLPDARYKINFTTTYSRKATPADKHLLAVDGSTIASDVLLDNYYVEIRTVNNVVSLTAPSTVVYTNTYYSYIINTEHDSFFRVEDRRYVSQITNISSPGSASLSAANYISNEIKASTVNYSTQVAEFSREVDVLSIQKLNATKIIDIGKGHDKIILNLSPELNGATVNNGLFIKYQVVFTNKLVLSKLGAPWSFYYGAVLGSTTDLIDGAYLILKEYKKLGTQEIYTGKTTVIKNVYGDDIIDGTDVNNKTLVQTIGSVDKSSNVLNLDATNSVYKLSNNFDVINIQNLEYYSVIDSGLSKDKIIIPDALKTKYTVVQATSVVVEGKTYETNGYYIKLDVSGKITYIINALYDEININNTIVDIIGKTRPVAPRTTEVLASKFNFAEDLSSVATVLSNTSILKSTEDDNFNATNLDNENNINEANSNETNVDSSINALDDINTEETVVLNISNVVDNKENDNDLSIDLFVNNDILNTEFDNLFSNTDESLLNNEDLLNNVDVDVDVDIKDLFTDSDDSSIDQITSLFEEDVDSSVSNFTTEETSSLDSINVVVNNANEVQESEIVENYKLSDEGSDDVLNDVINALNKNNINNHS